MCIICGRETEDTRHALCRCPHASKLWQAMLKAGNLSFDMNLIRGGTAWLFDWLDRIPKHERAMSLMVL